MTDETQREDGTVAGAQHIEQIREAFRNALTDGSEPVIEEYLSRVPSPARNLLLRELTAAELEHRKTLGQSIKLWEYYQRFPMQTDCVDAALRLLERRQADSSNPLPPTPPTVPAGEPAPSTERPDESVSNLVSEGSYGWDSETRRIAQFQLLEHLGEGRFGSVWKARDSKLDRTVALKIPRQTASSQRQIDLFFREARSAAQMRHANIVSVYEVGREGDTIYMATEFIEGVNLKEFLDANGPRSPKKAAEFCAKIADALFCAHEAGVIHRDLKPSNIMVDVKGQPHVADFGLAKRKEVDLTFTVEGQVLGTPAYMSPEQAGGKARSADHRTDVYALGVILFELLTGELPFRGDRKLLIMQKLRDRAPSPRELNSRVTRDLETICLKCLERDPEKRYQNSGQLADDLRRFVGDEPIEARPLGPLRSAWNWYLRHPQSAMTIAGSYMTLLSVVMSLWVGFGLLGLVAGVPEIAGEVQAIVELITAVGTVSLPMLYCGLRTLAGRLYGLVGGIILLAFCLVAVVGVCLDVVPGELTRQLFDEAFSRYLLITLLSLLFGFGFITHVAAMANRVGREVGP